MLERILKLDEAKDESLFLWGSSQTGYINHPVAQIYGHGA